MELSSEIMNILTGKKGQLRMLVGGRFNFSCRAVIRQDATLRVDQVKLPYVELVKCLQQQIINILIRSYNINPSDAYDKWSRAIAKKDERIAEIIDSIIHANPEGLPVIINRNPTIRNPYPNFY
jgi:DNA-directed RNA polymerase beta' subunit